MEVVISFQRPSSMTASEVRAWVIERALVRRRALALSVPQASWGQGLRLRVEIDDAEVETAEEELADLIMDMRLLGLRPAVLPHGNEQAGELPTDHAGELRTDHAGELRTDHAGDLPADHAREDR